MADEQTVADTSDAGSVENQTEGAGAQGSDDLESILNEFEASGDKPQTESKTETKTESKADPDTLARLESYVQRQEREQLRQDLDAAVNAVKGDADEDPEIVQAWLEAQAKKDDRLQQAWLKRHDNPQAWERVLKGLGTKFAEKRKTRVDRDATEDREMVAAAVRSASTKAPTTESAPNFAGMSNAEYRETVRKEYGFNPDV